MPPLPATRAYPLALALGAAAACGFAPLELWPLTLLCFAGLFALLDQATTARRAAMLGWWFGFGNFGLGLNWIATAFTYQAAMPAWLGWVAVFLVSIVLAVFPAVASGMAWWLNRRARLYLPLAFAAMWIINELLRATVFTGFAWNPLAAIWVPIWPIRATVAIVGTYGLSGLTILLAGIVAGIFSHSLTEAGAQPDRWSWAPVFAGERQSALLGLIALAIAAIAANLWLPRPSPADPAAPLLHVVQPNIGQENKWDEAHSADNYNRLAAFSGKPGPRPRIVLWPEVAIPALLEQDAATRQSLAALLGPRDFMLTGGETIRFAPDSTLDYAANSLFALDAKGDILGRYDKAHLVPFGEYLPMRTILSRIGLSRLAPGSADFNSGPGPRDVTLPGIGKIGVQICYEIIFSGHVIDRANRPLFLFNPSNDAWFGRWGPPQHLAQARLRAVEEGLPVIRSTPTGISAVIDADGRLLGSLPWRTAGAIELPLPPAHPPTPFARHGNILPLALVLFLGAIGFASRRHAS